MGNSATKRTMHATNPLRRLVLGAPVATDKQDHSKLPKIVALPVFASDAISSVAYASQEILLALGTAGAAALVFTVHISLAIVVLLAIVAVSYCQTVFAYPSGGGSYIVAKQNIGTRFGLIAAAALLIDYVLTVATSIASGVQNLTAMSARSHGHEVAICVFFVMVLLILNLRGLKESGSVFAIPTYLFVGLCFTMIFLGAFGPSIGWNIHPVVPDTLHATHQFGWALILNAFARGCSAMTGTEAISNGVPAFRKPESLNAAKTLVAMAIILGGLFFGISYLAVHYGIVYTEHSPAVIAQLNGLVFGNGTVMFYLLQIATVGILVLAANTSFADFPRLSSILARDGYMPRQLNNLGDKLTYTNGIIILSIASIVLLAAFGGNTDKLVPLYAIGVFIAFTLSQSGMVVHWFKHRGKAWRAKAIVNGVGALATFVVLCTIGYEKIVLDVVTNHGREFGWIVLVLIAINVIVFNIIHRHYQRMGESLSMEGYSSPAVMSTTAIILVPRLHRGVMQAIEYGRTLTGDVRGVHISIDPDTFTKVASDWDRWVPDIPLVVLPSPFRSVIGPLLAYLDEVERERPDTLVTVIVPEAMTGKWWHNLLHANYGAWIKLYLLSRKNIIVTNVRYFAGNKQESQPSD